MTEAEISGRLTTIFREVFDDDTIVLRREMTAADIADWDSASHITLIVAIETRLAIRFRTVEIEELKSVGALIDLVAEKLRHGPG